MARFILLEHTGAPDDPAGRHVDLLLEAGDACRTWRLADIPAPGRPPVQAAEISRHRLDWLVHEDGPVSAGRGRARRIDSGTYREIPNSDRGGDGEVVTVELAGSHLTGMLQITATHATMQTTDFEGSPASG
jgi:hypothetical protein